MQKDQEKGAKKELCELALRLYKRNMLAAGDGNMSVRFEDRVLITASGCEKAFMGLEDFSWVDLEGNLLEGPAPSSETKMHLAVYKAQKEARSVFHAHPPYAISWTLGGENYSELPVDSLAEVLLAVGSVPIVPFEMPGSSALSHLVQEYSFRSKAMILERHGALTWGTSPHEAWKAMERLEHVAEILWKARLLGPLKSLEPDQLDALKARRKVIGARVL